MLPVLSLPCPVGILTNKLAVPARSSYKRLKSSTLCFLRFSFFGASRSADDCVGRTSRLGIRLSSPGLMPRGLDAGTGRLVDLDGGCVCGAGYTGRARDVICGLRLVLTGRLGRRIDVTGEICESDTIGDMAGNAVTLGEGEDLVSAADAVALFVLILGRVVKPGSAMPPWLCGWNDVCCADTLRPASRVLADAFMPALLICVGVRAFLLGRIIGGAAEGFASLAADCEADIGTGTGLLVPDFFSSGFHFTVGRGAASSLRGAKPSVVAA